MDRGDLYSFWITDNPNGKSGGYTAGGGPRADRIAGSIEQGKRLTGLTVRMLSPGEVRMFAPTKPSRRDSLDFAKPAYKMHRIAKQAPGRQTWR
jgi:hypothetical protein